MNIDCASQIITEIFAILAWITFAVLLFTRKRETTRESDVLEEKLTRRTIATLKCGADLLLIDPATEMNFASAINGKWPKPVEKSEIFMRCLDGCKNYASCPVIKRLFDPDGSNDFVGSDLLGVKEPEAVDSKGRATHVLYPASEKCRFTVCGQAFRGNDNTLFIVRLPPRDSSCNPAEKPDCIATEAKSVSNQ